jgi:outer membrane protein TolC
MATMRMRIGSGSVGRLLGASLSLAASAAHAQQAAPPKLPVSDAMTTAPATTDETAPLPVPRELVRPVPGGLTSDRVGARAAATSWNAKASEETLRGAAARVDEAWASFLPRLSGLAKYTRLSPLTPTSFPVGGGMVSFPVVLNNSLLQATVTVPISDYFLRIDQSYTAATHSEEAARWDVIAARAGSATNGKVTYYAWLAARAAVLVAVQNINDQKAHLRDSRNQFSVGSASKADVLRAETAVAAAELVVEQDKNLADLYEKQVRVAVHASDEEILEPGEDLDSPLAPVEGNPKQLIVEAFAARPEIKSADANAASARQQAAAAKAGRYPSLSAFADGIFASPNPRVFPSSDTWFPTWDLGAQLTWSPNDVLVANGSVVDSESRAASIEANKYNVRDGIEVEVTQQWQAVRVADFSIDTSTRELASAEEAYRVQRELFNNGRGTSATLADAEKDLTSARFDLLNAKTQARVARVRLAHALGRDVEVR